MVIIGQDIAGYSIVDALDLPAPAHAYRAVDAEGREVTLYVKALGVSEEAFTAEVEQLMELSQAMRSVIPVLDAGVVDGLGWMVTPAADEVPVERLLARFQPIATELVAEVAERLCGAHRLGRVHGDLGPHTVVVAEAGVTAFRAFGFSGVFGAADDPEAEAARYRAPEIFAGGPIDRRTDVYGLGMLLHALLSATPPFLDREDLGACALHELPAPIDGASPAVNAVLARALAKDPDARFQTAEELLTAVRAASTSAPRPTGALLRLGDEPDAGTSAPEGDALAPDAETGTPDTETSGPPPASRDTLPTGTLPPGGVRAPQIHVVDLGKRRRAAVLGALLVACGVGFMVAFVPAGRFRHDMSAFRNDAAPGGSQELCAPGPPQASNEPALRPSAEEDQLSRILPASTPEPLHALKPMAPLAKSGESLRDDPWYFERY